MSEAIAQQRDHAAHMNLISKNVSVVGVHGFDNIGYQDWANQTAHEFKAPQTGTG
jgi:hypothetical protein